jgi:hypothetical protein
LAGDKVLGSACFSGIGNGLKRFTFRAFSVIL